MLTRRSLTAAALLVGLAACQPTVPAGLTEADRSAINALDESFTTMAMAADFGGLVKAHYSDDAILMPPNAPAATGPAAIEAVLRTFPPLSNFTIRSDEIDGMGDVAVNRGRYALTMTPPGGAAIVDSGKTMVILRRQPDGSWKITRDIWNSDIPLPAAEPAKPAK